MAIVNIQRIESEKEMLTVIDSALNAASLSMNMIQNAAVWAIRQTFSGNVTPCRKLVTKLDNHKLYMKYKNTMVEFMCEYGNIVVDEESQSLNYEALGRVEPNKHAGETWRMWNEHVSKARLVKPLLVSDELKDILRKIKNRQDLVKNGKGTNELLPDASDKVINGINDLLKMFA